MADITAAMVKALRERSGLPMMDCKKALQEVDGDENKAMELLRERGATAAEKKAGRAMGEGRIGNFVDLDKGIATLVEMQCETAPVSKNPEFIELVGNIAKQVAQTGNVDVEAVLAAKFVDDDSKTVQDLIHDVLNRIRENMSLARVAPVSTTVRSGEGSKLASATSLSRSLRASLSACSRGGKGCLPSASTPRLFPITMV